MIRDDVALLMIVLSIVGVEKFNFFGIIFDVFIVGDVDPFLLSYVNKS